jgi:hypothetical protein
LLRWWAKVSKLGAIEIAKRFQSGIGMAAFTDHITAINVDKFTLDRD